MSFWSWEMPAAQQTSLITVFCEEMRAAHSENWTLQYPQIRGLTCGLKDYAWANCHHD